MESGLLSAAVGAAACASVPPEGFRYYQCIQDNQHPQHMHCARLITEPFVCTSLVPIQSWIPTIADRYLLQRHFPEHKVIVETK